VRVTSPAVEVDLEHPIDRLADIGELVERGTEELLLQDAVDYRDQNDEPGMQRLRRIEPPEVAGEAKEGREAAISFAAPADCGSGRGPSRVSDRFATAQKVMKHSNVAVSNRCPDTGDRGFESGSLQRGVHCEPDFRGTNPIDGRRGFHRRIASFADREEPNVNE